MGRTPCIAGNWKMFKTQREAVSMLESLLGQVKGVDAVEILVCPPYTSLAVAANTLRGSSIRLGAQNVHWEDEGAFTGEVSTAMLEDAGCSHVILGHSERRQVFDESDETISKKLRKVIEDSNLIPILCVGETLEEREADRVKEVVLGQMERAMAGLTEAQLSRIIVAYEPVWAIGTGKTATPETAEEVHAMIRNWLRSSYSEKLADALRILYGGSVKPANIAELMAQDDIDGALVGGASLEADSFARIVKF